MGKLQSALAWASRGFPVFPLQENSKDPISIGWTTSATTDPETIRAWWLEPLTGRERDYNIGFLTNGFVVADVDTKAGKHGLDTFFALGMDFDTLTVQTPSGGFHLVYAGPGYPIGQAPIGKDIDIRSHNGYVVAPGSAINGVEYKVLIDDPVAPFPEKLLPLLKMPRQRKESVTTVDQDQPEFFEMAQHWLQRDAPVAVEGQNGDLTTFKVAARMRDFGLSEGAAQWLLGEFWNPRCEPPWSLEELAGKVSNAFNYASGDAGSATPEASFNEVTYVAPPVAKVAEAPTPYRFGNLLDEFEIEKRPWLMGRILLLRAVTMLVAASGGGKSMMNLIIAAHLAVGKEFLGHKPDGPCNSIVYEAEDDLQEQSRRLNAICTAYGLDRRLVKERVCLMSSEQLALKLTKAGQPININSAQVDALCAVALANNVKFIGIGPLTDVHTANENDPMQMNYVVGVLKLISRKADCAVMISHHTAKPPVASSSSWVGSQYAGRGSSATPGSARVVLTLFPASEDDCLTLGIPVKEKGQYLRLDAGKMSYSATSGSSWMRWSTVMLSNQDTVGVPVAFDARATENAYLDNIARAVLKEMDAVSQASLTIPEIENVLQRDALVFATKREATRAAIKRLFSEGIDTERGRLVLDRTRGGNVVVIRPR